MAIKDDTIAELRKLVAKQSEQITALTNEVEELKLQLAKAAKDSSNSSKPPSSDFVNSTKQKKKPGRPRKSGWADNPGTSGNCVSLCRRTALMKRLNTKLTNGKSIDWN